MKLIYLVVLIIIVIIAINLYLFIQNRKNKGKDNYLETKELHDLSRDVHSVETGHSYHSTSVKVGTKHHDAITHQETKIIVVTPAHEEEKITGYRCSCGKAK